MMKKTYGLLVAAMLAASGSASSAPLEELSAQLRDEIVSSDEAVRACLRDEGGAVDRSIEESWFYRRFWLRVRPKVAFSIPGFAKLEIIPETELLWEHALPSGWAVFKPSSGR